MYNELSWPPFDGAVKNLHRAVVKDGYRLGLKETARVVLYVRGAITKQQLKNGVI